MYFSKWKNEATLAAPGVLENLTKIAANLDQGN